MRAIFQVLAIVLGIGVLQWATVQAAPDGPATEPSETHSLLTPAEKTDIDAIIASIVKAGFPDATKAVVYSGKLAVAATFDPNKTTPPLPTDDSSSQMTNQNTTAVTYGFEFDGLHFKLADGSWIIALRYHFKPGKGDSVNPADAKELNLATLTTDAMKAFPFDARKQAGPWLEHVAAAQRERSAKEMDRVVPLTRYLRINSDGLSPAIVLLHQAGYSDAEELCFANADQRARSYWQLHLWTMPDPPFDPTGEYPTAREEEANWRKANDPFASEPVAVAFRRALFRWFRAQIMFDPEDAMVTPEVAAAAAKAAVDPKDPQGNIARVDALLAGAKLPVTVADNADLVARLQSWESRQRMPKMRVSGGGAQISTSFDMPKPAYAPDKKDLDALVALLGDDRPSRFFDFTGPRTVGDNAWRALAGLLNADPRKLAGYTTDHPWTAAERHAAAKAVQAWWPAHRSDYADKAGENK